MSVCLSPILFQQGGSSLEPYKMVTDDSQMLRNVTAGWLFSTGWSQG